MKTIDSPDGDAMDVRRRDAFAQYSLDVPPSAIVWRSRRRRRRLMARGSGIVAMALVTVAASLMVLSTRSPAYGWTASPGSVDATLAAEVTAVCRTRLPERVAGDRTAPLAIDRRGSVAVGLFERGGTATTCTIVGHHGNFGSSDDVVVAQGGTSPDARAQDLTSTVIGSVDGRFTIAFGDAGVVPLSWTRWLCGGCW